MHDSPFALDNIAAYQSWRASKLAQAGDFEPRLIEDPAVLSTAEKQTLLVDCAQRNFSLFRLVRPLSEPTAELGAFGEQLGLGRLDSNLCAEESGLTEIKVKETDTDNRYIPYTDKPLGWHTDGYYNPMARQIHGWLLYCVRPAAEGGENGLLDQDIAYIRLRDENPEWIRALMAPDAFTIPPNVEGGEEVRGYESGPVFSVLADGRLHMRYSARQRNILWKDDGTTREAAAFLLDLLNSGDDLIYNYRLKPGEGIVSNNILHRRTGFRDAPLPDGQRLIYRARYYDGVARP